MEKEKFMRTYVSRVGYGILPYEDEDFEEEFTNQNNTNMENTVIDGIDVSHWQSIVKFDELAKDGLEFVFHKATDGLSGVDNRFKERAEAVAGTGLIFGAYHFYEPVAHGALNGDVQANHFLDTVIDAVGKDRLLSTVLILDFEKYGIHPEDIDDVEGGEGDVANMELWFATLIGRLAGELGLSISEAKAQCRVMLYSYHQWTSQAVIRAGSIIMEDWIKLWGARYYKLLPVVRCGKPLFMWQKSDSQAFQGVSGDTDYDIVMASPDEWQAWIEPLQAQSDGEDKDNPGAKPADEIPPQ